MLDNPTREPAEQDTDDDTSIMSALLVEGDQRPWSIEELARDLGDQTRAHDSIDRLQRLGLIHRTSDDLVYPTRAAIYMDRISGGRHQPRQPLRTAPVRASAGR
jgi:hypothetical protein